MAKRKQKYLAVDLDGVLAELNPSKGNKIGKPIKKALPILKKFKKAGWYIILYTVRPDEWLLKEWCDKHYPGIFSGINCNQDDVRETGIASAKPYANLYLDDNAWPNCGNFSWDRLEEDLKNIL